MIASDSKASYNSEHGRKATVRANEVAKRPSERQAQPTTRPEKKIKRTLRKSNKLAAQTACFDEEVLDVGSRKLQF